jgi:hypothetical protein
VIDAGTQEPPDTTTGAALEGAGGDAGGAGVDEGAEAPGSVTAPAGTVAEGSGTDGTSPVAVTDPARSGARPIAFELLLPPATTEATTPVAAAATVAATMVKRRTLRDARSRRSIAQRLSCSEFTTANGERGR